MGMDAGRIEGLLEAGHSVERIMALTGVSRATVYRRRKALRMRQVEEGLREIDLFLSTDSPVQEAEPLTMESIAGRKIFCLGCGARSPDNYWCADCLSKVPLPPLDWLPGV